MDIVSNIAALTALTTRPLEVLVSGYATPNDGGGGVFRWFSADSTTANQGMIISPTTGIAGRYKRMFDGPVNVKWSGAKGDASTADDAAFSAWWTYLTTNISDGYIPSGVYRLAAQVTWNLGVSSALAGRGFNITTAGSQAVKMIFDTGVASPNMLITCITGASIANHFRFQGIGVHGNVDGTVLQIGRTDLSDIMVSCDFDFVVSNSSNTSSAIAQDLNYLINCRGKTIAVGASTSNGQGVRIRQVIYSSWKLYTSTFARGLYMTAGAIYGNVFDSPTLVSSGVALKSDSAACFNNVFLGGIIDTASYCFEMTNGAATTPNVWYSPVITNISTDTFNLTGSPTHSMHLKASYATEVVTPAVPATTVAVTNIYGETAMVYISGGTITAIVINGVTVLTTTNHCVMVQPGDTISITYTVAPTWNWIRMR